MTRHSTVISSGPMAVLSTTPTGILASPITITAWSTGSGTGASSIKEAGRTARRKHGTSLLALALALALVRGLSVPAYRRPDNAQISATKTLPEPSALLTACCCRGPLGGVDGYVCKLPMEQPSPPPAQHTAFPSARVSPLVTDGWVFGGAGLKGCEQESAPTVTRSLSGLWRFTD